MPSVQRFSKASNGIYQFYHLETLALILKFDYFPTF